MKSHRIAFIAMLALPTAVLAASIVNSKHDLSSTSSSTTKSSSETQICKFCHTPHNSNTGPGAPQPIWNRTLPTSDTAFATGTTTLAGTPLPTGAITSGVAQACLSCHDGSIALDALKNGGYTTTTMTGDVAAGKLTGYALLGTSLSTSHPFGVPYAGQTTTVGTSAANTADFTTVTTAGVVTNTSGTLQLEGTTGAFSVECVTCHDVHNGPGNPYFLNVTTDGSKLCLTCHNK